MAKFPPGWDLVRCVDSGMSSFRCQIKVSLVECLLRFQWELRVVCVNVRSISQLK